MRRSLALLARDVKSCSDSLIHIENGTFYRHHPSAEGGETATGNAPLFRNLNFDLPAKPILYEKNNVDSQQHWAIIGKHDASILLEILRGSHLCFPPNARTFPYLSSKEIERKDRRLRIPSRAIQYVGFNSGKNSGLGEGIRGAYLSARYESRREETDWSVLQYLKGETELNPAEVQHGKDTNDDGLLAQVIRDLRLGKMVDMPVSNLSNGQTRRARIARALLGRPELLLLDEPFMGLDPPTLVTLSPILRDLAYKSSPRLLLALRPQDPIPDWITHLMILGENHSIALMGTKEQALFSLHRWVDMHQSKTDQVDAHSMEKKMTAAFGPPLLVSGDSLAESGISPYNAYEKAKNYRSAPGISRPQACFRADGRVMKTFLDEADRNDLQEAIGVHQLDRTLQQWLTLTSALPAALRRKKPTPISLKTTLKDGKLSRHARKALILTLNGGNEPTQTATSTSTVPTGPETQNQDSQALHRRLGSPLIELSNVIVKYGSKTVLGHPPPQPGFADPGLNLTISRGTRLALIGPNGSGKTTLLALLTSDHPQSYSLPIQFFGRSRLPSTGMPGLSLWEIQSRIGHSSPEIHAFFPKHLSIRKVLESAWAETFVGKPKLNYERDETVDAFLRWWEPELRQDMPKSTSDMKDEDALVDQDELEALEIELGPEERELDSERKFQSLQLEHDDKIEEWQPSVDADAEKSTASEHNIAKKEELSKWRRDHYAPMILTTPIYNLVWNSYPTRAPPIMSYSKYAEYVKAHNRGENQDTKDKTTDWADDTQKYNFGSLPFSVQRLLLLLRAIIKSPDILILDEAFSGLTPEVRDKAMLFIERGETAFLRERRLTDQAAPGKHSLATRRSGKVDDYEQWGRNDFAGPAGEGVGADVHEKPLNAIEPMDGTVRGAVSTPDDRDDRDELAHFSSEPLTTIKTTLATPDEDPATSSRDSLNNTSPDHQAIPAELLRTNRREYFRRYMLRRRAARAGKHLEGRLRREIVQVHNMRWASERVQDELEMVAEQFWTRHYAKGFPSAIFFGRHVKTKEQLRAIVEKYLLEEKEAGGKMSRRLGLTCPQAGREDSWDSRRYWFEGLKGKPGQAVVVVSHVKEEIPAWVDEWLRLPGEEEVGGEDGDGFGEKVRGLEIGRCDGGSIRTTEGWNKAWGL